MGINEWQNIAARSYFPDRFDALCWTDLTMDGQQCALVPSLQRLIMCHLRENGSFGCHRTGVPFIGHSIRDIETSHLVHVQFLLPFGVFFSLSLLQQRTMSNMCVNFILWLQTCQFGPVLDVSSVLEISMEIPYDGNRLIKSVGRNDNEHLSLHLNNWVWHLTMSVSRDKGESEWERKKKLKIRFWRSKRGSKGEK